MENWIENAFFYHIYTLGFCDAPKKNDFVSQATERLNKIYDWIPHLKEVGINVLFLGPLFESESHGYDTVDYFNVDRRLGSNETLKKLVAELHKNGIKVVLDAVLNHSSRLFFAFKDLKQNRENSYYKNWYRNVRFNCNNYYNDGFCYDGWAGHINLVKYNHDNHETREHLFDAVRMWIKEFDIDGLRLDAADAIDMRFLNDLSKVCKNLKNDFWLKGEIVHGDYGRWIKEGGLDSTTNYEGYKSLWSSFNDKNFFEISYSLNRQFGEGGIYKNMRLYNFLDNHDVDRISDAIKKTEHLYPLYGLFFTVPGIPSLYYGSEFGVKGKRTNNSDEQLRPSLDLNNLKNNSNNLNLINEIKRFNAIRNQHKSLKNGDYKNLYVELDCFAFSRNYQEETIVVAVNGSDQTKNIKINNISSNEGFDILNNEKVELKNLTLNPNWLRIVKI